MKKAGVKLFVVFWVIAGLVMPVGMANAQDGSWSSEEYGPLSHQGPGPNQEPSPEEVQQMMQQMMLPVMGQMMTVMLKSMAETLAEPEIAQNFATFTRNFYDALLTRGFSREEALQIVTSTGVPSVGGPQQ